MTTNVVCAIHPRHADLVEGLQEYLAVAGKSARWLGLNVANDARLVANLRRGQHYPPKVMIALCERLVTFYQGELAKEQQAALGEFFEQQLAA